MKRLFFIAAVLVLVYQANDVTAANEPWKTRLLMDTLKADGVDPVCKMKLKAGTVRTHIHQKVLYGFCSEGCKKSFVKQPEKYLKK